MRELLDSESNLALEGIERETESNSRRGCSLGVIFIGCTKVDYIHGQDLLCVVGPREKEKKKQSH